MREEKKNKHNKSQWQPRNDSRETKNRTNELSVSVDRYSYRTDTQFEKIK